MEIDIFLLIFVLCVIAGALYVNTRLLFYYQDPADKGIGQSVFVKTVIVISLTLCWCLNILLPVDVRNSRPVPGLLDMRLIWNIAFGTLAFFLMVVIPATMFFYEADGDIVIGKKVKRHVMCNMFFMLVFVGAALGISSAFLSEAAIPVREYNCPETHWVDADAVLTPVQIGAKVCGAATDAHIRFKVGIHIYMVAFLCFIGWFFFVTFGGIGLSALPVDLIIEFIDRPKKIDTLKYEEQRREIGKDAADLLAAAEDLQRRDSELASDTGWGAARRKKKLQADYNKWKSDVLFLEEDFDANKTSKEGGENQIVAIVKLIVGILFAIMSIMWILHIVLYVIVTKEVEGFTCLFLNSLFSAFESPGLYPVGVAIFGAFNLYLLLCVVKGCLKFGLRIFIFFSIHPMKMHGTPLNSILFNILMVMLTSATVVQFQQLAFSDYARLTDADVMFSAQIKYLTFYVFFFEHNVFLYVLLAWFLLTIIFLFTCGPRDNRRKGKKGKKSGKEKKDKKEKKDGKDKKEDKDKDKKQKKADKSQAQKPLANAA